MRGAWDGRSVVVVWIVEDELVTDLLGAVVAEAQAHLVSVGVEVFEGPVARTGAQGPITSIYFRDPDGNLLSLTQFAG